MKKLLILPLLMILLLGCSSHNPAMNRQMQYQPVTQQIPDSFYTLRIFSKNICWMKVLPGFKQDIIQNLQGSEIGYKPISNDEHFSRDFSVRGGKIESQVRCMFSYFNVSQGGYGPVPWQVDFQIFHIGKPVTPRFTETSKILADGEIDFRIVPTATDSANNAMNQAVYDTWKETIAEFIARTSQFRPENLRPVMCISDENIIITIPGMSLPDRNTLTINLS